MTGEDDMPQGDALIAAEYVIGLLEGEDLLAARGRAASDPAFAALVAQWEQRLAPLLDEVRGAEPSPEIWQRIEEEIGLRTAREDDRVVALSGEVTRWKWIAGLTSAAAAVALAFAVFSPTPSPVEPAPQIAAAQPLVAQVPIGETGLRLDVTYIPESERMLVAAIGLAPDGVHDHELWLVPKDGSALQSLGVVAPGEVHSMQLPADIAKNLGDGVQVVLTREPLGGKPEGQDAGPVVAEGAFSQV